MGPTAYDIAFIAGGFVIIGAICGATIAYLFSWRLIKKQKRMESAASLRAAFLKEQMLIDKRYSLVESEHLDLTKLLTEAFPRHAEAVFKFREHLNPIQRCGLDIAWKKYCQNDGEEHKFLIVYNHFGDETTDELRVCALSRINAILSYANF